MTLAGRAAGLKARLLGRLRSNGDRAGTAASVNTAVLAQLRDLGGDVFLDELIDAFMADTGKLSLSLAAAVRAGDMAAVAAEAHALFSAAGNMGADPLGQICRRLQDLAWPEMELGGRQLLQELSREFDRVRIVLQASRSDGMPGARGRLAAANVRPVVSLHQ